ncbi:MAG: MvdC/MvdD family ATP grasp protein [Pseudomonadota bacterium]
MSKRILIVTHSGDLHADLVEQRIAEASAPAFRLNLDTFPRDYDIELTFSEGRWRGQLRADGQEALSVDEVGSVWLRKRGDFAFAGESLGTQEHRYAVGEVEHILMGLLHGLDCFWMSHPRALRAAGWKGEQMLRAASMGFRVPPSLVTNRPASVRQFHQSQRGGIVFKSMSSPLLAAERVSHGDRVVDGIPTTPVREDDLDLAGAVVVMPSFFQQHVRKTHELRVTVIGNEVFAAKIHSQDDPRTAVDVRNYAAEIRYEAADLPSDLLERCRAFVHSYDLTYGAIDIIVDQNGDYVFLENNPGGQYLYVEQLVPQLRMTEAVATCLLRGAR